MARNNRVKRNSDANYHLMSRCNNKDFLFGRSGIKGIMVQILKRAAEFSGIKLYAYTIMDNHFHIVVREVHPDWAPTDLTAPLYRPTPTGDTPHFAGFTGDRFAGDRPQEVQYVACERPNFTRYDLIRKVLGRISILKGDDFAQDLADHWGYLDSVNCQAATDEELKRWLKRMHDVSQFTKTYKELVNIEYKRNHKYCGSIFAGRFASTLIEDGRYLATCIRYVELNSVRAGMVKHAREYAYSSQNAESINEIATKLGSVPSKVGSVPNGANGEVRTCNVGTDPNGTNGTNGKVGTDPNEEMEWTERRMRCKRVVQIGAGVVFGSKAFVESVIGEQMGKRGFLAARAQWVIGDGFSSHGHKLAWELEQAA